MRTVLIADDEPLILTGLSEKVDWARMGCRVVGVAMNGLQALSLMERLEPDILLTDIVMPGQTGLELAAWIRRKRRGTQVILLSTYDHFEYAQEGIRMGVCGYILKPIDMERLREAVGKAQDALDEQERLSSLAQTQRAEGSGLNAETLYEAVQYGAAVVPEEAERQWRFADGLIVCMKAYNEPRREGFGALLSMRRDMARALEGWDITCYSRNIGQMLVFVLTLKNAADAEKVRNRAHWVARRAGRVCDAVCVAAVGRETGALEQLHAQYEDCARRVRQAYFATESGLWQEALPIQPEMAQPELDEIRSALTNGSEARLRSSYDALCQKLLRECDPDHAAHTLREAFRLATAAASIAGMVERPALPADRQDENFDRRRESVWQYMRAICDFIRQSQDTAGRLRLLMRENCLRASFSLSEAAERMGMSVPYLSRLFKKELGENFQDILANLRIDKARELLSETRLRNHEIAKRVGFEDERYFGQVFRRRCGMTPGQYRASLQKNQQNQQ